MKQHEQRMRSAARTLTRTGVGLLVAAAVVAVGGLVLAPKTTHFELTSGTGFTITSAIYASPACSGPTALLYPGTTDCLVFTVRNNLSTPITVTSIDMAFDSTYPAPPSGCATSLVFPTFTGNYTVPGSASASLAGLPITWTDTDYDQDDCADTTLHFVYSGTAQYTDATSTVLASAPDPSDSGSSVTFTATVNGANASIDPSTPAGTVTFYTCANADCSGSTTSLGSGVVQSNGQASLSTSGLPVGTSYIEAIYTSADTTTFTGSTSNIVTQTVNATPAVAPAGTTATTAPTVTTAPTTTIAPVTKAATKKKKKVTTATTQPPAPHKPVTAATTTHTGEPWAGTGPLVAALGASGALLLGLGLLVRRRPEEEAL